MNLVEKRLRDKFLTRVTGKTDLINFPEMEGFLCLFGWSKKQPWWDKFISDFLLKNHWEQGKLLLIQCIDSWKKEHED